MSAGRTGKPSGATRSSSKRHPHTRFPLLPEIGLLKEGTLGKTDARAPAVLEALAPRPRGGTVETADLKSEAWSRWVFSSTLKWQVKCWLGLSVYCVSC